MNRAQLAAAALSLFVVAAFGLPDAAQAAEAAPEIYQLHAVEKDRALDQKAIEELDGRTPPWPAGGAFAIGDIPTTKGANTIYRFVSVRWGATSESSEPVRVHDLLLVEVDGSGAIVAAAHYTLEWQDTPSLALFRATKKGAKLTDGLRLSTLALATSAGNRLATDGVLDLVLGPRRVKP